MGFVWFFPASPKSVADQHGFTLAGDNALFYCADSNKKSTIKSPLGLKFFFILSLSLGALIFGTKAAAVSLDDLTVSSAVGERFYSVIKISGAKNLSPNDVLVSLAPRSIYQRMGVDWEYFHTTLIFDVLADERNEIYIRVVSSDIVFEPYLDFVIAVRWPSGYISKQYTVLLEMPTMIASPNRTAAVKTETPSSNGNQLLSVDKTAVKSLELLSETDAVEPISDKLFTDVPKLSVKESQSVKNKVETLADDGANKAVSAEPVVVGGEVVGGEVEHGQVEKTAGVKPEIEKPVIAKPEIDNTKVATATQVKEDLPPKTNTVESSIVTSEPLKPSTAAEPVVTLEPKATAEPKVTPEPQVKALAEVAKPATKSVVRKPVSKINNAAVDNTALVSPGDKKPAKSESSFIADDDSQRWQQTTQSGDNLWRVARRVHAESGGNLRHIVDALYKNNPKAFMGNDANRLKVNARLSVSMAQIRALAPASARAELAASQLETPAVASAGGSANKVAGDGAKSELNNKPNGNANKESENKDNPKGVLSLVANTGSLADNSAVSAETAALSERSESLTKTFDQQLKDGKSRAVAVDERIDNLYNQYSALSEKTEQLRELEQALNRSIAEKAQVNLDFADGAAIALPDAGIAAADDSQPANTKTVAKQESKTNVLQLVLMFLLAAMVVLLIIVLFKFQQLRRRAELAEDWQLERADENLTLTIDPLIDESSLTRLSDAVDLDANEGLAANQPNISQAAISAANAGPVIAAVVDIENPAVEASEVHSQLSSSNDEPATMSEGAVELEASLLIAYERFDQAELLLEQALERQPENTVLQSQLLEVYAAKGKDRHFDLLATQLGKRGDMQLDIKINKLRKTI